MKNRKQLPSFGYIDNVQFDVEKILSHLRSNDLLNFDNYNDIKVSSNSKHKDFVISNEFSKSTFFVENNAEFLEGEKYKQLYLTDFDESKRSNNVKLGPSTIFSRTKRLNSKSSNYLPEADELNYGVRNHHVSGVLSDTLDWFKSKITRVRLACLKSDFAIKPHVDYDPSYIVRYHLPLITNEKCLIHSLHNGKETSMHFPSDGKLYFLNTGKKHWASNDGKEDRLHLIIDVHGQIELENLISL